MPKMSKPASTPTDEERQEAAEIATIQESASQGLIPLEDSPALNKLLIRHARKSARDIEALTGIPAEEVAERLDRLLDSSSIRDDLMEEKLLLLEVAALVEEIRQRSSRAVVEDEAWASMARVQLAAIKTMLEQVEKRRKALDGRLATLTIEQAQMFAETVRTAHDIMIRALEQKYPELDVLLIHEEFQEALPKAIEQLENKTNG